jgi:acetyl-CoA C-acetyltransferase
MIDDRTPILIGAGQLTQRDVDPSAALEPVAMMAETARRAAADAGQDARLLAQLDRVAVVNVLAWHYGNAPGLLAARLGAHPAELIYTTVGGNTPQWLVNETAAQIAAGHVRLALIAGAEAVYTLLRARRSHTPIPWLTGGAGEPTLGEPALGEPTVIGETRLGTTDHEMNHGLQLPTMIYPLFENALRARDGRSIAAHQRRLGELCARQSAVAAHNPYAWFQQARSAEEIATVTPQNRFIGFPYPKYMNAIIDVDQSASVLMTSVAVARELGIDPSRWVYLWGCGDARDLWLVSERVNYHSSPAIRVAGERALAMAGVEIGDIDFFDLYSCFPSAVQIGRDMLGIPADDPRPLTVTGGLPYHGGPGNNYTTHAIATMMQRLRATPAKKGLVTALGWYLTKHSVGIYSATPPPWFEQRSWMREDPSRYQPAIDAAPHPELVTEPRGRGVIETYTVLHGRDGDPVRGIVIGRLDDDRRFIANTPDDRAVLDGLMAEEAVGRAGTVTSKDGMNTFAM